MLQVIDALSSNKPNNCDLLPTFACHLVEGRYVDIQANSVTSGCGNSGLALCRTKNYKTTLSPNRSGCPSRASGYSGALALSRSRTVMQAF